MGRRRTGDAYPPAAFRTTFPELACLMGAAWRNYPITMNTPPPYPNGSDCVVSAARLNAIADRTAAHYPSLAAELRRIARHIDAPANDLGVDRDCQPQQGRSPSQ